MAIAHPQFGMIGETRGQFLIQRNRLCIAPNPPKCRSLQILLHRIVTVFGEHSIQMLKRLWKPVLFIQHRCQIGTRSAKVRCQLKRAAKQCLAILQPAHTRRQFRHHANGGNVRRRITQMTAQQRLCILQPVFGQRDSRRHKVRIAQSSFDSGAGRYLVHCRRSMR